MKWLLALVSAASLASAATATHAATDIGVSIGINQPGIYGRVDIGNYPPPPVVYAQPVLVAPPPVVLQRQPIYLYVPPQHQRDWRHYCNRYAACGQPVYFVQEQWVQERYAHEHQGGRQRHDDRDGFHDHGKGHGKGHWKDRDDNR